MFFLGLFNFHYGLITLNGHISSWLLYEPSHRTLLFSGSFLSGIPYQLVWHI